MMYALMCKDHVHDITVLVLEPRASVNDQSMVIKGGITPFVSGLYIAE